MRRMLQKNITKLACVTATSALMLCISCSPGGEVDPASDKFLIYNLDTETGEYELERVSIETLRDVRAVDGDVVEMRGGGNLKTGISEPTTREEWEQVLLIENTITPQVEYTVDRDGTVVPWDFDSAMMLTVYHHFERAREYFDALPLSSDVQADLGNRTIGQLVDRIPCYYYPSIAILGVPIPVFVDNAAYAFTLNGFIVPPRQTLVDAVPIYANRGVITHEYSHAVFNRLVYNGLRVPDPIFEEWGADRHRPLHRGSRARWARRRHRGYLWRVRHQGPRLHRRIDRPRVDRSRSRQATLLRTMPLHGGQGWRLPRSR